MSPSQGSHGFFPAPWRARAWAHAAAPFDVIVVGGGITGAGIARDATLRGLRVGLFEQADFGSGTSSRSSRLVHGGVRYLEHGHLHLVLESSRERRTLLHIAPHLVRPLAFTWPVYAGARVPLWKLRLGLTLYDVLALYRNVGRSRRLAPDAVRRGEPNLLPERLVGGARYYDAATDDARLVLANVVAAHEQGAIALNYAAVTRVYGRDKSSALCTVEVRDVVTGNVHRLATRAVVFALGPWSDEVPALIGQTVPKAQVVGSVGAHVALSRERVGNVGAVTLIAPADGRVFFVVPADDLTIATTTEAAARARPDEARATRADVQYLLSAVNHYFPATRATPDDVVAAWAGVRPLAAPNVKDLTSASREHEIAEAAPGVYVVTGGKLTTFRAMAEQVVDLLARSLLPRFRRAVTSFVPLPGGELTDVRAAIAHACEAVRDQAVAERLVHAYGTRWPLVWNERSGLAEVFYAIEREFAVTLADVLVRRVPMALERSDHAMSEATRLATALAPRFGWDARAVDDALRGYQAAIARQFSIDEA